MLARTGESSQPVRLSAAELCAEFDIGIVSKSVYPQPGQTRAVATIERMIAKRGASHARLVLCLLAESRGNNALIDEVTLGAISDLILACPDLVDNDMSALLDLFDQIPLGPLMMVANELSGHVPQRPALAGMLYLQVRRLREQSATRRPTSQGHLRKADRSEVEKGRAPVSQRRYLTREQKVELGRKLLEVKAKLPRGHFGPWLAEQPFSDRTAHAAMQMARAA